MVNQGDLRNITHALALVRAEAAEQEGCGLAFDFGREKGALELQRVLADAEMLRDCDARAREEIERQREELRVLRASLRLMGQGQRGLGGLWGEPSPVPLEAHAPLGQRFSQPITLTAASSQLWQREDW